MMNKVKRIVNTAKTHEGILNGLKRAKIPFEYNPEYYDYFNVYVPVEGGKIRIWERGKQISVDMYRTITATYSGIPTFCPSGRYNGLFEKLEG